MHMNCKIINCTMIVILALSSLSCFCQAINRDSTTYEIIYQMEIRSQLKNGQDGFGLPATIKVEYDIITNGRFYLLKPKLISVESEQANLNPLVRQPDDSFVLDKQNELAYILSGDSYSGYT